MKPHIIHWWNSAHRDEVLGIPLGDSPVEQTGRVARRHQGSDFHGISVGVILGVRRPLRFLATRLSLRDDQVAAASAILDDLKTDRAQAAVDERRTLAAFADAVAAPAFDEMRAGEAAALRGRSAAELGGALVKALARMHALLDPEQRTAFAALIRSGAITL
jgi:ABC-type amino acid transport substrate-binding protein